MTDGQKRRGGFTARIVIITLSRRDGRAAEGAPLLREYGRKTSIEGSNPSLSARRERR